MIMFEKTGDVLSVVGKEYVVHTISGDYVLGAGIAKKINEMMDMSKQLHFHYDSSVNSYVGTALPVGKVFNLVVKETCRGKVDPDDMYEALCDLRRRCERIGIAELSMPRIGCGGEHMDWSDVKDMLEDVFDGSDIEITIYTLPSKSTPIVDDEEEDNEDDCNCNCECNCDDGDCDCDDECDNDDFDDDEDDRGEMPWDYGKHFDDEEDDDEYEENEIVKVKPAGVTNERKIVLYNNMLEFLADLFDEETLYDKLLEIGFYPDEIEYEGYAGEDEDNTFTEDDEEADDEDDCECECGHHCNCSCDEDGDCACACGGECHCDDDYDCDGNECTCNGSCEH